MQLRTAMFATLLASTTGLSAASAATFGGITAVAGAPRVTNLVSQASTLATLGSMPIQVRLCSGAIEFPSFVPISATEVGAAGSCYQIIAKIVGPTVTEFSIIHTGGADGVRRVAIGSPNAHAAFDRTVPMPGTVGSGPGLDLTPIAMGGTWTAWARYADAVRLVGAPPVGDLYCNLTIRFSSCFDAGDVFVFQADTDSIN